MRHVFTYIHTRILQADENWKARRGANAGTGAGTGTGTGAKSSPWPMDKGTTILYLRVTKPVTRIGTPNLRLPL